MNHPYLKHSDNHTVATILDNPQYKPLERTWHHHSYERQSDKTVLHIVKSGMSNHMYRSGILNTDSDAPLYLYFWEQGIVANPTINYATKETILDLFGIEL